MSSEAAQPESGTQGPPVSSDVLTALPPHARTVSSLPVSLPVCGEQGLWWGEVPGLVGKPTQAWVLPVCVNEAA